jgi:excisionase family DNA binding protein
MDKLLLRPEEAAEMLGVSRASVYRLLENGVLAGVRIGASRRIAVTEVEAFVARLAEADASTRGDGPSAATGDVSPVGDGTALVDAR